MNKISPNKKFFTNFQNEITPKIPKYICCITFNALIICVCILFMRIFYYSLIIERKWLLERPHGLYRTFHFITPGKRKT